MFRPKNSHLFPLGVFILLVSILPCPNTHVGLASAADAVSGQPDYWPTDGWLTSTPEEQGMNSTMLDEVEDLIVDRGWTIDSVLVIRNGYIVYEIYPNPEYDVNTPHQLASAAKSITAALIGAAITRGNLSSLEETVVSLFPERVIDNLDADKASITVENLLTMSSGLTWDDSLDEGSDLWQLFEPIDFIQYILDKPMAHTPGTYFSYSTADSHLLSAIINHTTGRNALEFGSDVLFGPLGISSVEWSPDNQGVSVGGALLNMTPRDMAKIGFLYLNNGTWDDQQIISSSYMQSSVSPLVYSGGWGGLYYGYQWWVNTGLQAYSARGAHAQRIFVQPKNNLIVVITTPGYSQDFKTSEALVGSPDVLIQQGIIPAITSESTPTPTPTVTIPVLPPAISPVGLVIVAVAVVAIVVWRVRR